MAKNQTQIDQDLQILKLEDRNIDELSIRDVILSYRKLAKKLHPDTSGYDSKEDFQALGNAYERILEITVEKARKNEEEAKNSGSEVSEEKNSSESGSWFW